MADASLPRIPSYIDAPLVEGYARKVQPNLLRTDFDSGFARVRNRSRRPIYEFPVRFRMTRPAFVFWDNFYQGALNFGAAWFVMPLATSTGMFDAECRLKEPPQDAPINCTAGWDVQTTLEVRNVPQPTVRDAYSLIPGLAPRMQQFDIDINGTIGHAGQ